MHPPPAEAAEVAEAGSYGTLIIKQHGWYVANFHVLFVNGYEHVSQLYNTGCLSRNCKRMKSVKIPNGTTHVDVILDVKLGCSNRMVFRLVESVANNGSRIELTSANVSWDPKVYIGINYGWYKKY